MGLCLPPASAGCNSQASPHVRVRFKTDDVGAGLQTRPGSSGLKTRRYASFETSFTAQHTESDHVLRIVTMRIVLATSTTVATMPPPTQAVRLTTSKSHGPIG